jgi:hypothetical protein
MMADSTLYSESNLKLMSNIKRISRVPLSIKRAKNLVKAFTNKELKPSNIKGCSYQEEKVSYGGNRAKIAITRNSRKCRRKKADLKPVDK